MKFTKYSVSRIICCSIITVILFDNGLEINTWQFWVVYLSAWAMSFIQYCEDFDK
jgi:NhaP-type Na+/H+ and K+/H+ antiporter